MLHMSNYITNINFSFITSILKCAKTLLVSILTMYIPRSLFNYSTNYNLSRLLSLFLHVG